MRTVFTLICGLLVACGGTTSGSVPPPGFLIRISSLSYSPVNLAVPPGATVIVLNDDPMPHSVTSESSPGAFTPGSVAGISFDTGPFTDGQTSFVIPATAPEGAVIPYYCSIHRGVMHTPDGFITVSVAAQP